MKAARLFVQAWQRLGLRQRLLALLGISVVTSFVLLAAFMSQRAIDEHRVRQAEQMQEIAGVLVPLVAEQVLIGDYASLRQLLLSQLQHRPQIVRLGWEDSQGVRVETHEKEVVADAPRWVAVVSGLRPETHRHPVELGGVTYGSLVIDTSPASAVNALWRLFSGLAFVTGLLMLAGFFLLNHVLRTSLRAVDRLAVAAARLRDGSPAEELPVEGSSEVRATVAAFNDMSHKLTRSVRELSASQRQVGEQLRFVETLFEAFPSPVCIVTREGIYRGVNRAWESFFGIPRDRIIGTHGEAFHAAHPGLRAVLEETNPADAGSPATRTVEMDLSRNASEPRKLHVARATYSDSEHEIAGTISVITDLTALAEAEQRVQAALVEKAAAEAASEAKSRFMANMSHEIRTPLTAIIGYAESLLDSDQGMEARIAAIRTIIRAGHHLHQIINDILDLSKIEAGRLEVECIPVNVIDLCREVATLAQVRADEKGLLFRLEHEFPLPAQICTDPLRLRQILINLIGNAVKFTARGNVTMRVRCDRAREQLVVAVHDSGIGLSAAERERLFSPFAQADASTTRRYGGTGLGLYLSRQLAQQLGGDITVASEPGQGSTFTLTVATRSLAKTVWVERDTPPAVVCELVPGMPGERLQGDVLVVEDNDDNRRLITLHLRKLGIAPHYAVNGAEAVARAVQHHYALILMDMQMPVMDGLEATACLRAAGHDGPIVALTANASKQDEQRCREAGCDGFVPKPIDREMLFREVRRYLRPESETQAVDGAPLVSALYDDEPELAGLVEKFIARFPEMLAEMEAARARADWAALKGQAHNLKGVGGGYGYPDVSKVAARLEFAAAKADQPGVSTLLGELNHLARRIARGWAQARREAS